MRSYFLGADGSKTKKKNQMRINSGENFPAFFGLKFASLASPAILGVAVILSAEKARTRRRGHVRYGNPA
jgi:hypothetical protein